MPAFTAIGAAVVSYLGGAAVLGTVGAAVLGGVVATGAAYVTSRIINGNQNKGNNSAATQGGRIQVPPATNNKIPVVYGSAYVNGIITDARLKSISGTTNDTMYYCLVLSEYTNNLTTPTYGLESVVWNDLRLTPVDATTNAHKVKDGRKVVDGAIVTAGAFVVGTTYVITKRGTTSFTAIGAQTNNIGQVFTATGVGTGTGQAQEEDFIDTTFVVDSNSLVELRVYAGGSAATDQIYPPQSTANTTPAYTFWGNNDGSWTSANEMDGLVFAIVKMTYATNGFTSLPNVTFQLANNVANPADVWYDYMTSVRYGAGIPAADIDTSARTAWFDYCAEDINYTGANLNPAGGTGTADQVLERYQINGILDTGNQVKTNIDTILQNGGAWMSYDVATGLWSPVIKKAVSAGVPGDATTYFTASRANDANKTITVTAFPNGRIEPGQLLYTSDGIFRGTVTVQQAIAVGDTAGQIGTYTTATGGGAVASTTWYAVAPNLLEFSDDNIISGISISSTRLEDLYNKVEVEFYDKYNRDQKAYYRTSVPNLQLNPNEPVNALRMSLDLCNNSIQSDLLGQIELRQSRDDLVIEFTSNFYGIQAQAGDVINVTSDLYGWAPKPFRVMRVKEQETEDGGLVAQIQALEYNADAYTIESISEFSTAANIKIGNLISSVGLPAPENPVISLPNPAAGVPNFVFSVDIPATGGPFDELEIYYTEGWDPNSVTGYITPGVVAVTGASGTGATATLTFAAQTFTPYDVGQSVTISGMTPSAYNGVKTITAATSSSISYSSTATGFTTGGIITSSAGAGFSRMRVNSVTYNSINVGDYFDLGGVTVEAQLSATAISTKTFVSGGAPGAFTVTFNNVTDIVPGQILSAGTGIPSGGMVVGITGNQVTLDQAFLTQASGSGYQFTTNGGTGVYRVTGTVFASGTDDLFDQPVDTDFIFLKNKLPDGNATAFPSPGTESVLIVELPANSQTFRRYFLKSRLGNKKNFGRFSPNVAVDLNGNSVSWQPNPSASGGSGVFGNIEIAVESPTTISVTGDNNFITISQTSTSTSVPQNGLRISVESTGTPAAGFGTNLEFEIEVQPGVKKQSGLIECALTDVTATSEDAKLEFTLMTAGVETPSVSPQLTLENNGNLTTVGHFRTSLNDTATPRGVGGVTATNDFWFVGGYDVGAVPNAGAMVIASGNNGTEPIYVRQYTSPANPTTTDFPGTGTYVNQLTLLDANGNTTIPGSLTFSNGVMNTYTITSTSTTPFQILGTSARSLTIFAVAEDLVNGKVMSEGVCLLKLTSSTGTYITNNSLYTSFPTVATFTASVSSNILYLNVTPATSNSTKFTFVYFEIG